VGVNMNKVEPLTPFVDGYSAIMGDLPGQAHPRIAARRAAGIDMYRNEGLPVKKVEAWKYTRLKDLETGEYERIITGFDPFPVPSNVPHAGINGDVVRVVMVDGCYDPKQSDIAEIEGLQIRSLRSCLLGGSDRIITKVDKGAVTSGAPLAALSSAYLNDGVVVQIEAGVKIDQIIEIVVLTTQKDTPTLTFPRVVINIEAGASATVVESYFGQANGKYAVNAVTDIDLNKGASLKHYVLQSQSSEATHVFTGRCDVPEDASYEGFVLQVGGKTSRHEMRIRMIGEQSEATLNGAYGVRGSSHCDTTTVIDHVSPRTNTDQVFKGILDDQATGVYQGKVHVHRDAQQINGNQLHNAMLLSRKAHVKCKPELMIYADDVKCSHGATVGELDEAQVFYLRSRGVDEMTARAMLVQAFMGEALDLITNATVREAFHAQAAAWFAAGEGA